MFLYFLLLLSFKGFRSQLQRLSWSDKVRSALMYDGMEHASAYYGKQTRSEVPEAYVEHMSITILVRVKRKVPKKSREVKINFIRVVYR